MAVSLVGGIGTGENGNKTSSLTYNVTGSQAINAGDLIVACISYDPTSAGLEPTITDNLSNSYSKADRATQGSGTAGASEYIGYAYASAGGTLSTVTATWGSNVVAKSGRVMVFRGVQNGSAPSFTNTGTVSGLSAVSATLTPGLNSDDLMVCGIGYERPYTNTHTWTNATGDTNCGTTGGANASNMSTGTGYRFGSSLSASSTITGTLSAGCNQAMVIAVFPMAVAGSPNVNMSPRTPPPGRRDRWA